MYENIFTGETVKVITTYRNEVEYIRSPVVVVSTSPDVPDEIVTNFIKPKKVFEQCYEKVK